MDAAFLGAVASIVAALVGAGSALALARERRLNRERDQRNAAVDGFTDLVRLQGDTIVRQDTRIKELEKELRDVRERHGE